MAGVTDAQALLEYVIDKAKRCGATACDALVVSDSSAEVRVRLGQPEVVKQSRSKGLGLRVLVGRRSSTTSSSDLDRATIDDLVERTCQAARLLPDDEAAGLPEAALFEDEPPGDLDLYDASLEEMDADRAIELALEAEAVAQSADERITNSEGARMGWGTAERHIANSLGVYRSVRSGSAGLYTVPVAEHKGGMERDYWYTSARHLADLDSPAAVGEKAAQRTLRRLGARKPETSEVPVIFEWTVASGLLGALADAITGGSIYRKASYLTDKLGERIASELVDIRDDARIPRGPGSRPFDGEGLATGSTSIVERGVLKSYLLDTYSARKLGLKTTRNASRGLAGTPHASPTNFWMAPGDHTLSELIADTPRGVLITELIGFGINAVTGDYSQGASGLWIEDGKLSHPVSEMTIASTLPEMWAGIDALADDRDPSRSVSAPSFRIRRMTVAGS